MRPIGLKAESCKKRFFSYILFLKQRLFVKDNEIVELEKQVKTVEDKTTNAVTSTVNIGNDLVNVV
jgi:hypothetical protein